MRGGKPVEIDRYIFYWLRVGAGLPSRQSSLTSRQGVFCQCWSA